MSEKDIIPGQKEETSITERSTTGTSGTTGTTGKKPPVNESSIFNEDTSYDRYLAPNGPLSMNLKFKVNSITDFMLQLRYNFNMTLFDISNYIYNIKYNFNVTLLPIIDSIITIITSFFQ